jgi:hypothetical protein
MVSAPGSRVAFAAMLLALHAGACEALGGQRRERPGDELEPPPMVVGMAGSPAQICRPCGSSGCLDCGGGCRCLSTPLAPGPWTVPLTPRGANGWRASQRALCVGLQSITGHAIWADEHGVFAAVSGTSAGFNMFEGVPDDDAGVIEENVSAGDSALRTRVFHNEGDGWSLRADLKGSTGVGLTAASAERLIIYGDAGQLNNACTLGVLAGDMIECREAVSVLHAHAVHDTLAFALTANNSLFAHDGREWTQQPAPTAGARALWADEDELVAVGRGDIVMGSFVQRFVGESWVSENVGGGSTVLTAVWGRGDKELWVGDAQGRLLHFDGASWQEVARLGGVTCSRHPPIVGIWGAGEHVWVHTSTQLARWNGSELESFGNWSCAPLGAGANFDSLHVRDVWGVDENNVFIAFSGGAGARCGDAYLVHYDGSEFHRF